MSTQINYKLALALKNAGFPQKKIKAGDTILYKKANKIFDVVIGDVVNIVEDGIRIPTLSELIEACGEGFMGVRKNILKNNWFATALPKRFFGKVPQAKDCKTPEEAVAKLWLKLNER